MKERREPETLWEQEQQALLEQQHRDAQQKRVADFQKLTGYSFVPKVLHGSLLKTLGTDPVSILKKGGYTKLPNKSWMRNFDGVHRYHVYILPDNNLQIHTDKYMWKKNGEMYHLASNHEVKREKTQLRKFIVSHNPQPKGKKAKPPRLFHDEVLTYQQIKEAVARLKNKNDVIN